MGRSLRCRSCSKDEDHEGLNRGAWTAEEDMILSEYIKTHGVARWRSLPKKAGLKRCGKSCRLRWLNYLRPDIKHGNISPEEEELLIRLHRLLGNRWSLIAGRLPGRTDNEIKNYWNTHLRKKVEMSEIDQKTQKPFKSWGMPSYSDYKEEEVEDKTHYFSQTAPLETRAVRYCGRAIPDVDKYSNNNYDLVQDTHDGVKPGEEDVKAADVHLLQIDTSKSWRQLLLEDCLGDDKYDRLEMIDGLETHSFGIEHHLHPQIPSFETHSSHSSSFDCHEFQHSNQFHSTIESFLGLSELPYFLP